MKTAPSKVLLKRKVVTSDVADGVQSEFERRETRKREPEEGVCEKSRREREKEYVEARARIFGVSEEEARRVSGLAEEDVQPDEKEQSGESVREKSDEQAGGEAPRERGVRFSEEIVRVLPEEAAGQKVKRSQTSDRVRTLERAGIRRNGGSHH